MVVVEMSAVLRGDEQLLRTKQTRLSQQRQDNEVERRVIKKVKIDRVRSRYMTKIQNDEMRPIDDCDERE